MDSQVDFYILSDTDPGKRLSTVCRIVEKARSSDMTVLVQVDDDQSGKEIDSALWTFRQGSFIPHEFNPDAAQNWLDYPVQIALRAPLENKPDVLLNMCREMPSNWRDFARVIDIVPGDERGKTLGRQRYRHFRENGITPNTHNL